MEQLAAVSKATTLPPLLHPPCLVYCSIDSFKHLCSVTRQNSGWVFQNDCNVQFLKHFGFLMTNQLHTAVPIQAKSYVLDRPVFCKIYNIDFSHLSLNPSLLAFP